MSPPDTSWTPATTESRRSQLRVSRQLKIMQQQAGHAHASTTSLYTCVSSDFRTRTLRRVLDETVGAALGAGQGSEG